MTRARFTTTLLFIACGATGWLLSVAIGATKPVREIPIRWPPETASRGISQLGRSDTGPPDGTVQVKRAVLRVFGDYQCPACRDFDRWIARELEPLVEAGRLEIVQYQAPLRAHPKAALAGAVAHCAAARTGAGDAAGLHAALFETSRAWSAAADPMMGLLDAVAATSTDTAGLNACVQTEGRRRVAADRQLAAAMGVSAVPALFLNDSRLEYTSWRSLLRHLRRAAGS